MMAQMMWIIIPTSVNWLLHPQLEMLAMILQMKTLRGKADFFIRKAPGHTRGQARFKHGGMLVLLKYPFYPLFILDNGTNLIPKSLTVLTSA